MKYILLKIKYDMIIKFLKIFCFFVLTTYYLLLTTSLASAQEFSLGISPQIIKISANQGEKIAPNLELENFSDRPIILEVYFREFTASEIDNNQIEFVPDSKEFARLSDHISVILDDIPVERLTISPKQKQSLALKIDIPDDIQKKDYTFTVVFKDIGTQSNPNSDESSFSIVSGGIGMNVLLSIGKAENENLQLNDFSTKFLVQNGPVPFNIQIKNPGKHIINPTGTIDIYNMFSQHIGKIPLPKLNILSGTNRTYLEPENLDQIYLNINKDIKIDQNIIWPEKILLGLYTANLKLSLENGNSVEKTIYFLALPYKALMTVLAVIGIIIFIKNRVSYHLDR